MGGAGIGSGAMGGPSTGSGVRTGVETGTEDVVPGTGTGARLKDAVGAKCATQEPADRVWTSSGWMVEVEAGATRGNCGPDTVDTMLLGGANAGRGRIGVGSTTGNGGAIRVIVGVGAMDGADCANSVGTLGQPKLEVRLGVGTGTEAAEGTGSVLVCCGRTGADGQVKGGGLTVEGGTSTSGALEDAGIDPSTGTGMVADEEAARNAGAAVAFVGNDQTDSAAEEAASTPEAAFFAASAAAAAPNPFHVSVGGVEDPTGLLEGKVFNTSGAHLKTGAVASGAEAMDTEVSPGVEIEANELGAAVND